MKNCSIQNHQYLRKIILIQQTVLDLQVKIMLLIKNIDGNHNDIHENNNLLNNEEQKRVTSSKSRARK